MKFTELQKSIREGLAPVYLIEGDEAYFRDHAVEDIRNACNLMQPFLNDMRLEGSKAREDYAAFLNLLFTVPVFDERRLVRVYDFYPTEKEWESHLKKYAENSCPSTVLVIVNPGKKAGSAELKRKKGIVFVDCARESEEVLAQWIFRLFRRQGLQISTEAASLLVRYCNQNAARMKVEAEKLALLYGEGAKISRAEVEEHVAKDVEYKIYELTQAASRGNSAAFHEILNDLLNKGFDEIGVLSALTSHYRTLLEVSSMRGSDEEIAKELGIKPFAVSRNRETARRLGKEKVGALYTQLYALSCGAKSGIYSRAGALSAAIAKIFFG